MNADEEALRSIIGQPPTPAQVMHVFGGRGGFRRVILDMLAGFETMRRAGVKLDNDGQQMLALTSFALSALDGLEGAEIVQRSLCLQIELCGASVALTHASTLASDVRRKLAELAYGDPSQTHGPAS